MAHASTLPRTHDHHHHDSRPASTHTRRLVNAILLPAMLLTVVGLILLWPSGPSPVAGADQPTSAYGTVAAVRPQPCPPPPEGVAAPTDQVCGEADVGLTEGPGNGSTVTVPLPSGPGAPALATGDRVVLSYTPETAVGPATYAVVDHQRGLQVVFLLVVAAVVIVAFGRLRGFTALLGLVVSFAVLLIFIIPGLLRGEAPLLVAIVGSAAIMFAVLYLTHGVNVHTSVAILGTLAALVLTGLLGAGFSALMHLTGFGSEESLYLSIMHGSVDMRGLLLAGIIIGTLGVLDDVTVTQAVTVAELAPGSASRREVYRAAIRIGRAHIASAVNTIVLAYAGAALPLLLLVTVSGRDPWQLITSQFLTQEILRSVVGTIGLVAAVPITTALAALVVDLAPAPTPAPSFVDQGLMAVNRRSNHDH
jgi:uncharacterized membrane protein